MYYTRVYSGTDGRSYFEKVDLALEDKGVIGHLSRIYPVTGLQFRSNDAGYNWDYHNAPCRQFIILLDGEIEITVSSGETRRFVAGEVLLVEDVDGDGHKTRNVWHAERHSLFLPLAE
ncbi:cupin domain-containing protein [Spirochaeta dissipatitropha]